MKQVLAIKMKRRIEMSELTLYLVVFGNEFVPRLQGLRKSQIYVDRVAIESRDIDRVPEIVQARQAYHACLDIGEARVMALLVSLETALPYVPSNWEYQLP
jgi:hypothetical protein